MRNTGCPFCNRYFNDKQKFCHHIAAEHNEQVPEEYEPLEYAYSLLVHKDVGRVCLMCRKNQVHFNQTTLKYERLCSDKCKEEYVKLVKGRMVNVYGKEHLLNDPEQQRKMLANHANAKDFVWDEQHKFRVVGTYEEDFLKHLKSLGWSPNDILTPSPNTYQYKWKDGSVHFYIPDFRIISLNLEVEIKQGGFNDSFMEHNREIESLKDKVMQKRASEGGLHYIKILDKDYTMFDKDYVKSDNNRPE